MEATITYYSVTAGGEHAPASTGYLIETSAGHRLAQDYAPGKAGNVSMSEAEARAYAEAAIADLLAAMVPPDPAEPMPDPAP